MKGNFIFCHLCCLHWHYLSFFCSAILDIAFYSLNDICSETLPAVLHHTSISIVWIKLYIIIITTIFFLKFKPIDKGIVGVGRI